MFPLSAALLPGIVGPVVGGVSFPAWAGRVEAARATPHRMERKFMGFMPTFFREYRASLYGNLWYFMWRGLWRGRFTEKTAAAWAGEDALHPGHALPNRPFPPRPSSSLRQCRTR